MAADGQYELFRVPITGGESVRLSGAMVANGSVGGNGNTFRISPDGHKVLYLATQENAARLELFATFDGDVPPPTPTTTPTITTTPPTPTATPTATATRPPPTDWAYLPVVVGE